MRLPIFDETPDAKQDEELLKRIQTKKKKEASISKDIFSVIEKIREDVEAHLGEYRNIYKNITSVEELEDYIQKANEFGYVAIDTETTGLNPITDDIVGISMYFPEYSAVYIPINHLDYYSDTKAEGQLSVEEIRKCFEKLTAKCIFHNAPFDIRVFKNKIGVRLKAYWDTHPGACLLNENEDHKLKVLTEKYITKKEEKTFKDYFENFPFNYVPISFAYLYAAHDAIITYKLYEFQKKYLNDNPDNREDYKAMYWVFRNIEMPMVDVIVDLEENGVAVDMDYWKKNYDKYHKDLDVAEKACNELIKRYQDKIDLYNANHPVHPLLLPMNISSDEQSNVLFYDILEWPRASQLKKIDKEFTLDNSDTSVDKKMLSYLRDHDVVDEQGKELITAILSYRQALKKTGTYIDNIPNIMLDDGRVHTHFNSNGAVTGRMSSSKPINLQNIPSDDKEIRKMFVGQTTFRDVEKRQDNAYILNREEEVQLQNGEWVWAELVKVGDVLESGEKVKAVKIKEFKVLIGV